MAERNHRNTWERAAFTPFRQLEEFCASVLNDNEKLGGEKFKSSFIEPDKILGLETIISEKLKMLLLKKAMSPELRSAVQSLLD